MSDEIPSCSRCRKPLSDDAFALSLEKALPDSVPQDLRLCPLCVESFRRWYERRGKSSLNGGPSLKPKDAAASPAAAGSQPSKRRHRHRKKRMHPVIRILLVTVLSLLLFAFAFYWTWTILKTATRTEE